MGIIQSYGEGLMRSTKERKMVFLLWICNALFGSAIYFLVSGYLKDALGNSSLGGSLLKGFDFGIFLEIFVHKGGFIRTIVLAALILGIVYFWISVFLHGGILFVLRSPRISGDSAGITPRFTQVFFEGAGKFFGRFFRLTLYSVVLWIGSAILFFLLNALTGPLVANGLNEKLMFYLLVFKVFIGLFLFFLIRMIMDYARIMIVIKDTRFVFRSLFQAVAFVFRRMGRTLGLYYLLILTGVVLFLIYWGVQTLIPTYAFAPILLAFFVGQLYIVSRGWLKVAFQASQLQFFSLTNKQV